MNDSLVARAYTLKEMFSAAPPKVSFEFFPPKNLEAEAKLWLAVTRLQNLHPEFVSVTYGAGGFTRTRTHETLRRLLQETDLTPAAHLTCVAASKAEVDEVARDYWNMGVRHIVALRGDMPGGGTYQPHGQGYHYASDLVAALRKIGDFDISVAAYPEKHPEAESLDKDIEYLKRKVDAGANRAITQFFFDVDVYLKFIEKTQKAGINVPIVPGILPVTNVGQLTRFAASCGTNVPDWLANLFAGLDENPEFRHMISAIVAAEQCRLLRRAGIEQFHFYTLNRARLTLAICHILGIRAKAEG